MKKIKIFAAFGKDVEEDVTRFGDFLCALNAQCKNIELSIFKSEKELCESLEQPKEKVDSELDSCEYFLLILGGEHDDYPFEKLNQAIANYAKKTLENGYNARLKRAVECIERGELERAKKVLDPDGSLNNLRELENRHNKRKAEEEIEKNIAQQEINIQFAEIDRLKLDTKNLNRFDEIEKRYANIEHFQENLGLEVTVLFEYAYFLDIQNKHSTAIEKYTKELERCKKFGDNNDLKYIAGILNNLAILQVDTKRYTEAEVNYIEALCIRKKLMVDNR